MALPSTSETGRKKRATTKYWVKINDKIYARLQYKTLGGKYKVKYEPITDKRTARSVVERMRSELETRGEELFNADKLTFSVLTEKYEKVELVEATYQNGIKIKGRRSVSSVRSAIKPLKVYFGTRTIGSIKPSDIRAYKNERLSTPVVREVNVKYVVIDPLTGKKKTLVTKEERSHQRKLATVNRELASLRAILNFAIDNDWLEKNPFQRMRGVISISAEVERDRVLSFEEEERLLAACTGERAHVKPLLICALDTAMRRGEMFKMIWADIDFVTGKIFIPQTNTKTEESRIVAMTPRLRLELERMWSLSPREKSISVFGIHDNITKAWASVCRLAEVADFRLHDCRHSATTRMVASGSPHTEVMKITGHSQLKTFLRYLTITTDRANDVANRLSEYHSQGRASVEVDSTFLN